MKKIWLTATGVALAGAAALATMPTQAFWGGNNWGNIEYDMQHSLFTQYFRTADPRFLRAGEIDEVAGCAPAGAGIDVVKPGNTFGDIGHAIQSFVESQRMSVVTDFCGHGLGRVFHSPPNVLHYGKPGTGAVLEPGMFFTIEPMVNLGRPETKTLADDWTAVTRDKSLSAQFEHSVGVTANGAEIFTLSPAGRFFPTWGA